jgi:hypothetical protein
LHILFNEVLQKHAQYQALHGQSESSLGYALRKASMASLHGAQAHRRKGRFTGPGV